MRDVGSAQTVGLELYSQLPIRALQSDRFALVTQADDDVFFLESLI
jgi:hypothetical protein